MAVEHLVWFKLNEGVTDGEKAAMMNALRALKTQVPNILHLAVGEDFSGRSIGFEIGLVVRLPDKKALEAYGPHPDHAAFGANFRHFWSEVIALDFETQE